MASWSVRIAKPGDAPAWDGFVAGHPGAVNYHRWNWQAVIRDSFGWSPHYLLAEAGGRVVGVLPLLHKKTIFGTVAMSVPFFSVAGVLAESEEAETGLVTAAIEHAKSVGAGRLELRQASARSLGLPAYTGKATLVLPLEADEEQRFRRLDTKMRTNVRRSLKNDFEGDMGGPELISDFYRLFAVKMRDFGTPVYAKSLFENIFREFPGETYIYRILHRGRPVAATLLTGFAGTVEANWSSSLASCASLKPNLAMYWMAMGELAGRGYRSFDFGRSTVGGGTYNFKRQWNAEPVQLHWYWWSDRPAAGESVDEREHPLVRGAMWVWRRLPVRVTTAIGPLIARDLP